MESSQPRSTGGSHLIWVGDPPTQTTISKPGQGHCHYREKKRFNLISVYKCMSMNGIVSCKLVLMAESNFPVTEQSGSTVFQTSQPPTFSPHSLSLSRADTVAFTHYLSTLACYQRLCSYLRPITLDLLHRGLL